MTCDGPVSVGENLSCEASVSTKDVDYKWTSSAGNIFSGQRTSRITIANLPSGGLVVSLEVSGTGPGCPHSISQDVSVTAVAELVATFNANSTPEQVNSAESKYLGALNADPSSTAYVVVYPAMSTVLNQRLELPTSPIARGFSVDDDRILSHGATFVSLSFTPLQERQAQLGASSVQQEANQVARTVTKYLVDHGVKPDRIKVQFGPAKPVLTVELYKVPLGANPPSLYRVPVGAIAKPPAPQHELNLLRQDDCKDVFGGRVAKRFYCIEVLLQNSSQYNFQVDLIGFTVPGFIRSPPSSPILPADYLIVRSVIARGQRVGFWNIFSTDRTFQHLGNLENLALRNDAFHRSTVRPNTVAKYFVFFPKDLLSTVTSSKEDIQFIRQQLGDLVVRGRFDQPVP